MRIILDVSVLGTLIKHDPFRVSHSLFVAGSVQRGTLASEWEGTQTTVTPALTHLVGPFCLCSDL